MQTLSNGVKKPEDDDSGNVWSDGLEANAEFLNDLITTVNNLSSVNITKPSKTLDKADWITDLDGKGYVQLVEMPVGSSLDIVNMRFRVTSGAKLNRFINPSIIPTSLTTFNLVVNDPTLDLEILFI